MIPTPSTSHVDFDYVYEPAEDSFLLLDTLSSPQEKAFLHQRLSKAKYLPLILEVGTGSGVVLSFLTANAEQICGRSDLMTLGVDVSHLACNASHETVGLAISEAQRSGWVPAQFGGCVVSDLTSALRPSSVDVLVFNPPYVPSETIPDLPFHSCGLNGQDQQHSKFQQSSDLLALATDGGEDGMIVTNRLFDQLPEVLSPIGVAYVLLCAQNNPQNVVNLVRQWPDHWCAEIVGSSGKQAGWEKLCILRIERSSKSRLLYRN